MQIRTIIDEDFVNYKKASMFIGIGTCNWKCCKEANIPIEVCQNSELMKTKIVDINNESLFKRYINNTLTNAIVFGGLEPFTCFDQIISFIDYCRTNECHDDIVIYTGFYPEEIESSKIEMLKRYDNIIIKFGRFKPNSKSIFDELLGITLISDNQYAKRIEDLSTL